MAGNGQWGARSTADEVLAGLDLTGRTILITGINAGIGQEAARALAARGAHIIALARSQAVAAAACARIGGQCTPIACDLADLSSVAAAASAVRALGIKLDVLMTNAGIMAPAVCTRLYGVESQFLINHVAHFMLVDRLVDLLPDGTGRIVTLSSSASIQFAPREGIMFDNLDARRFYKPFVFYGQSKLANALHAVELSRRLAPRGIVANAVHPGVIASTKLGRSLGFPMNLLLPLAGRFTKSIPQGAATQSMVAASPLVAGVTGEFFADCAVAQGNKLMKDPGLAAKLWDVTERIIARA